jgi:hypothetical protein
MFMKPIPIGKPKRKQPEAAAPVPSAEEEVDTGYELMLTDEAMQEWRDAEARDEAQARARLTGKGMLGTLLDIKV